MTFHDQLHGQDLHDAKFHTGFGSPIGVLTPDVVGLGYYDLTAKSAWISTGLTNLDWELFGSGGEELLQINGELTSIVIGTPVYSSSPGTVKRAQADNQARARVLGMVVENSIGTTLTGRIIDDGVLIATTVQWDAVTGGVGGLFPNVFYYLDPFTAGRITTSPPQSNVDVGKFVVILGLSLDSTTLDLRIHQPVLL